MAIKNRAWFKYNTAASGYLPQLDSNNYIYIKFFPPCQLTGAQICSIYAIYDHINYGDHPIPLVMDSNLEQYILDSLATHIAKPSGAGQKKYVYVGPT